MPFMLAWLRPTLWRFGYHLSIVGGLTLAIAFLKVHNLSFGYYIMYLVEFNLLPKKRVWTQGTGTPFISPFETVTKKQETTTQSTDTSKPKKNLNELVNIVDSYGKNAEKELAEKMKTMSMTPGTTEIKETNNTTSPTK